MGILVGNAADGRPAEGFVGADAVQCGGEDAQVGDLEDEILGDQGQALGRQGNGFENVVKADGTDALQACLHHFAEAALVPVGMVDVLVIIDLLGAAFAGLLALDDAQGHVGFQGQQLAAEVIEGDEAVGDQEILVADVVFQLLEFAHFEGEVAVAAVELPQGEDGPFFVFQDAFVDHASSSPESRSITVR